MQRQISKFFKVCLRKLNDLPDAPCPLALECINEIKSELASGKSDVDSDELSKKHHMCPWFVASADYNYCFWKLYQSLSDSSKTDKEICDLLMINKFTLDKIVKNAIKKLKSDENKKQMLDFKEAVKEVSELEAFDHTTYMPSEFKNQLANIEELEEETEEPALPKIKKKLHSLPVHRSGKKIDIYGLSKPKGNKK